MPLKIKKKDQPIAMMLSDMLRKRGLPQGARQRVLEKTLDAIRLEELKLQAGQDDPSRLTAVVAAGQLILRLPDGYSQAQRLDMIGRWMKAYGHKDWEHTTTSRAADGRLEQTIVPKAKRKAQPAPRQRGRSKAEAEALAYLEKLMPELQLGGEA